MSKNTVINPENEIAPEQERTIAISRNEAARQQTLRNISLIIVREYKNRVAQRAFVIITSILLVLLLIGTCVPTVIQYFAARSSGPVTINVINNAGTIGTLDDTTLAHYISTSLNGSNNTASAQAHFVVNTQTATETTDLQNAVKNGKVDALLILQRGANNKLSFTTYTNVSGTDLTTDTDLLQIQNVVNQLNELDQSTRLGLNPTQTQSLFAKPDYSIISTLQNTNQRSAGEQVAGYFLAYIGVILIFMAIFMYGMGVATGVAEEKGTRIMEILVNAATPFQLMAGKIIGIGAAGLTQMGLLVTVGILGFLAQPLLKTILGIPPGAAMSFDRKKCKVRHNL
jgi:ABC-2 type transport system permease protein